MKSISDVVEAATGQSETIAKQELLADQLALVVDGMLEQKNQIAILSQDVMELTKAQNDTAHAATLTVVEVGRVAKQLQYGQEQLSAATTMQAGEVERNIEEQQAQALNLRRIAEASDFVNSRVEELQRKQSLEVSALREEISRTLPTTDEVSDQSHCDDHRLRFNDRRMSAPPDLSKMEWNTCKTEVPEGDSSASTHARKIDTNMVICASISRPPEFNPDRFEDYKKRIRWWAEMHGGISDSRLLSAVGMRENGPAKMVSRDYFQSSREDTAGRTLELFLSALDTRYKKSAQDILIQK